MPRAFEASQQKTMAIGKKATVDDRPQFAERERPALARARRYERQCQRRPIAPNGGPHTVGRERDRHAVAEPQGWTTVRRSEIRAEVGPLARIVVDIDHRAPVGGHVREVRIVRRRELVLFFASTYVDRPVGIPLVHEDLPILGDVLQDDASWHARAAAEGDRGRRRSRARNFDCPLR